MASSVNSKDELIRAITNVIKNNRNHEITGNVLQEVLLLMVDFLATDGNGKTIPVCTGTGKAKGDDGINYDGVKLQVKGGIDVSSGGVSSEQDIYTKKNLDALGDLFLGTKGVTSSVYLFDKNNPSVQYRIYVKSGSLTCEQV